MHATEAVTPAGVPLGLLDVQLWLGTREEEEIGSKAQRKTRPIAEKESNKWLKALRRSHEGLPEGVQLVTVCDRESDIYEFFDLAQQLDAAVVVRAAQDRRVEGERGRLWAIVQAGPQAGTMQVHIPARDKQPAREAQLAVRFAEVVLRPPQQSRH